MTHITVAHFPPFDTVTEPAPSVPALCNECSGLGCDACCFTGREYTPREQRESTPCVDAANRHSGVREEGTQMDEIRARHAKGEPPVLCRHDPLNWPCDTQRALDALDESDTQLARYISSEQAALAATIAADPTLVCPDPADHALADAVRRLPERIPFNRSVEITRRHGTTVWEVYVWNGDDIEGSGIHADLKAAITAALEPTR